MHTSGSVAAVDLGATSGRVIVGHVDQDGVRMDHVARFPNGPVTLHEGDADTGRDALHWDVVELYRQVTEGLRRAFAEHAAIASIGIDSWAVDYALLRDGRMLGVPYHYRDERNNAAVEAVHGLVSPAELYAANGLQFLPFNSLYQLTADRLAGSLEPADGVLLVPDLLGYWLTGRRVAERTNASTTGLVNIATGEWDAALLERLQLPTSLFPELVDAGTRIGPLLGDVAREIGIDPATGVTAVGSHDTASAVLAVPAQTDEFAYISCGTWGLVGVELERPELSEAGRLANFTNEGGVDGTVRYLHNVMGLWLLSESVREWERGAAPISLPALLAAASAVTAPVAVFDANDPRFLTPGDMPARIAEWCRENGAVVPGSQAEFVRSIIESLAAAFVDAVRTAASLSGKRVSVIHIVGGGSQNELLCQLIADRSGLPVQAGPVEATAIGNVLVQARAAGLVDGSRAAMRSLVAAAFEVRTYTPVN
jgi:rhamnulokinase